MTDGNVHLKIEAIDIPSRQVLLQNVWYPIGDRVEPKFYKAGDTAEIKISEQGIVIFMRKDKPPQVSPPPLPPPPPISGFVPAVSLPQSAVPFAPPPAFKTSEAGIMWRHALTEAVKLLELRVDPLTGSELNELDLVSTVLDIARKLYEEGMEKLKTHV